MCGICGFTWSGEERREGIRKSLFLRKEQRPAALEAMMDAVYHRGPDEGGMYLDAQAALGFRRLRILDLEGSMQPMKNETGDKVLVFNGEIYNYRELREELEACGHRFQTKGDSEVLLHGYEEWGDGLPERLRGMFAFGIWDTKEKELFLARDFFGIKPLYYMRSGSVFLFASEIKSILEYPGVAREVNEEALEQYLSFQYSVLNETFFRGICRLEPGTCLRYRAGSPVLELRRYFEPELAPGDEPGAGGKAGRNSGGGRDRLDVWAEAVSRVMKESVCLHGQADVEVGAFLSGGVDSAYTAALLAEEGRDGEKKAYTVGFGLEEEKYDERAKAGKIAKACGLLHKSRLIQEGEFWSAVPEVMYYLDEPLGDPSAVALYFLSREAAREVKAERDEDDGIPIYDIEFETEYGDYDYEVAISGGKIVGADYEVEEEWARRQNGSAVSADDVKKIAQEKVPGVSENDIKVWKESDDDDDENRYEGQFRYDSMKYEFEVDASTGIIIDWNADLRDD